MTTLYERIGSRDGVRELLKTFYAACGEDPVVGPVFAREVADWDHHIELVTDFWSTQTGGPRLYPGGMGRHIRLGLGLEHFDAWLAIWEKTCRERFAPEDAEALVGRAHFIAGRLKEMTGNA